MARMMGKNAKRSGYMCSCTDCAGLKVYGRTAEKRQWKQLELPLVWDGASPEVPDHHPL